MAVGLNLILPGVAVADPIAFDPDVPAAGWWMPNSTPAIARRNLVTEVVASVVGAPVYQDNFVTLRAGIAGQAHFVTDISETLAMSGFAVVRVPNAVDGTNATLPVYMATADGSGSTLRGLALIMRGTGRDAFTWTYSNAGTPTGDYVQAGSALPAEGYGAWRFIGFATDGTTYHLYDMTNGQVATKVNTATRVLGDKLLIGNMGLSARSGVCNFAGAAVQTGAYWSDSQFETLHDAMRELLADPAINFPI